MRILVLLSIALCACGGGTEHGNCGLDYYACGKNMDQCCSIDYGCSNVEYRANTHVVLPNVDFRN